MFLDQDNKTKLVPASSSYVFLELLWKKKKFSLKSAIVITVLIYLHCKETNQTVLSTMLLQKCSW